ncbi:MAG: protease modulator HflC [Gammaproteobacteria bacterium]|nr:protease modulator HflC [Gammaproteobacteria bacterium]
MPQSIQKILVAFVALGVLISLCTFTVSETELAVRRQFREIIGANFEPGLHFKLPIDTVHKFERRIVSQSFEGETFLTSENRGLIVDYYVKWRIKDAGRYAQAFGNDPGAAGQRLSDIVKDGIKNAVAQRTLQEIVSAERTAFTGDMFDRASKSAESLGLQLIDTRVQKIGLPPDVESRVYASMQQSFSRLARQLRGEGEKEALRIRAEAERKRTETISIAIRDSLKIRGDADSKAAATYSAAYGRNPEFYAFYRSIQAYKNALGREGDIMVVSPDSDFFKYLRNPNAGTR